MEINDIVALFSEENIRHYSQYFSAERVAKAADEIVRTVRHVGELSGDERLSSVILAMSILNQQNRRS